MKLYVLIMTDGLLLTRNAVVVFNSSIFLERNN